MMQLELSGNSLLFGLPFVTIRLKAKRSSQQLSQHNVEHPLPGSLRVDRCRAASDGEREKPADQRTGGGKTVLHNVLLRTEVILR